MATPDVASALEDIEIEHIETSASNQAIFTDFDNDDSSLRTVDSLVRRRAAQNPSSHIVSYPSTGIQFIDYTMQQLDVFAWRVAKHYEKNIPVRVSSSEKPRVVALLGPSNLEYLVTVLALTKLGHTALLLSTRIPQPAIESLLSSTGSSVLLSDARHQDMTEKVRDSMGTEMLTIVGRSAFEYPIEVHSDTRFDSHLDPAIETTNIAFIIHSSGAWSFQASHIIGSGWDLYELINCVHRLYGSAQGYLSNTQVMPSQLCYKHGYDGLHNASIISQSWNL